MSTQTKEYGPLAGVLAVTLGVVSGIVFAIFKLEVAEAYERWLTRSKDNDELVQLGKDSDVPR
jgi:hypothetical protein